MESLFSNVEEIVSKHLRLPAVKDRNIRIHRLKQGTLAAADPAHKITELPFRYCEGDVLQNGLFRPLNFDTFIINQFFPYSQAFSAECSLINATQTAPIAIITPAIAIMVD